MMNKFAINEIFYSLQGEGYFTGTPAVFIRFAGCNLSCPFCDTDFSKWAKWSLSSIREYMEHLPIVPPLVVLTGGEPSLQVTQELCDLLHRFFPTIAMETNGTRPEKIPAGVDFVTVSPKDDFTEAICKIKEAGEVKVVFDGVHNPAKWQFIKAGYYYIQPCDTGEPERNQEIIKKAVEYVKMNPLWRLSLQTQKILSIQ